MASESVYETPLDLPSRGMASSLPKNEMASGTVSETPLDPPRRGMARSLSQNEMCCEAVSETALPSREDDPPLPSRARTSTTRLNGTNHYISVIRGDDSHGKFKNWINSRLHIILTIFTIIIVILLVFIAVVTGKLIYLESIIEEQGNQKQILLNTNNLTVVPSDVTDTLRNELKDLSGRISHLFNDLSREEQSRQSKEAELEGKINRFFSVAFHATVNERYPTVGSSEKVKFDKLKLKAGNGYNGATGVFTAHHDSVGTYFFSTHVLSEDSMKLLVSLKKNDDILCSLQEENTSGNEDGTGSCSVTVELKEGDRVYVERGYATNDKSFDCIRESCGFTGFLMKPK